MKQLITYIIISALLLSGFISYGFNLNITGKITKLNTEQPIVNHRVDILIDSMYQGFPIYYNTLYTDINGDYYDIINIPDNLDGIVVIYIDSCYYNIQSSTWFSDSITTINRDFQVCDNSGDSCEAFFQFQYTQDPMLVEFIDMSFSQGTISSWQWDFGDGLTSQVQNPIHTFSTTGIYDVSLEINTTDSCTSSFSQPVWILEDTNICQAAFSYELDTLNLVPNTFEFNDESEGDIQLWYWDFGDGSFSEEQNPIHTYQNYGNYYVCLTITNFNSGTVCSSVHCDTISTLEYYNFGGQAFLGDYPINIDSTDDENQAIVYLYRKISNNWKYMDYCEFWKYGYYWFTEKPIGEYLLLAELTDESISCSEYSPSYYPSALTWKNAGIFTLSNDQQFAINIEFKEFSQYKHGIGTISGKVILSQSCDTTGLSTANILIQLTNTSDNIIATTYSDYMGNYNFSGLGTDSYIIHAEYPGLFSDTYSVNILDDEPNPSIDLEIHCSHILGISENIINGTFSITNLSPNPVNNAFTIDVESNTKSEISIKIVNSQGIIVLEKNEIISMGKNQITTNVNRLPQGYYLIILHDQSSGYQQTKKFIVVS